MAQNYDEQLTRGALINLIGLIAKAVHPLFIVIVTWLFGPEVLGLYAIATAVGEIAATFAGSGFADATIVYASHHADDESDDATARLYRVLGNGFGLALVLSALLGGGLFLLSDWIVQTWYADRPILAPALRILAIAVPLTALPRIAIAATKARMLMQYDAGIMGFVRPLVLLGTSALAWVFGAGVLGLMWAHVATQAVVTVLALGAVARHFDLGRVRRATFGLEYDAQVMRFAIPQSVNLTFNQFITGLDVIMLGAFGVSNQLVGFYKVGAEITRNIRQVKLVFSDALAPVAARHHASGDRAAFEETLGRVSRWTTTLAVPLLVIAVVHRADLVRFIHESFTGDTGFMIILLIPPFLSCAFGLAGNSIIYTGHSAWTMANALLVAGLNGLFNWWMIPRYGLLGAATATALASTLIAGLQLVELRMLEQVRLRWSFVYQPHVALWVTAAALWLTWDPVDIPHLAGRVGLTVALCALYLGALLALRHPEARAWARRLLRRR